MNRILGIGIVVISFIGMLSIVTLFLLGVLQVENALLALIFYGQFIIFSFQGLLYWEQLGIISAQSEPSFHLEFMSEPSSSVGLEIINDSNNMARSVQFEQVWSRTYSLVPVDANLFREGKGIKKYGPRSIPGGMLRSAVVCSIPRDIIRDRPAVEISYMNVSNKKQFIHFLIFGDPTVGERIYDIRRGRIDARTKLEMQRSETTGSDPINNQ